MKTEIDITEQLLWSLIIPKKYHAFIREQAKKKGLSNEEYIKKLLLRLL